jgi:hypothetical protein
VHDPQALADAILWVKRERSEARKRTAAGKSLVQHMFEVKRTALEVYEVYRYVLGHDTGIPPQFDAANFIDSER